MKRRSITRSVVALALLLPLVSLSAEEFFGSPLGFKGATNGDSFESARFKVSHAEGKFTVTEKEKGGKFTIEEKDEKLQDATLSDNGETIAVFLSRKDRDRPSYSLIVVDAAGKTSKLSYKPQEMSDTYGWLVGIGAVSNDGSAVLAECARMVRISEMRSDVRHDWLIISIEGGNFRILESENAFTKWASYSDKKK